ncbi:MAG: vWA domain-containing protein [Planctomycetota bacterium]|jgi:hypothetical protein
MTFALGPTFAEGASRAVFEWGRIESRADFVVPVCVLAALVLFARRMIRLDTQEHSRSIRWLLTGLRTAMLVCLFVVYLKPQWRSERELVQNSRVLVAIDTSSSMGMTDVGPSPASAGGSRLGEVAAALDQTDFIRRLRKTHDVVVFRFDEDVHRLTSFEKLPSGGSIEIETPQAADDAGAAAAGATSQPAPIDWQKALEPVGAQTRLGYALRQLVQQGQDAPLSAVVVFTDGGHNAGISPEAAIEAAREAKVPILPVGVGSQRQRVNVRAHRLEAPPRAYPGDPYSVTGLIQAQGLGGTSVTVELLLRNADTEQEASQAGSGVPVDRQEVVLGADGELVPVKFELTPGEAGRRVICLRVRSPFSSLREGPRESTGFCERSSFATPRRSSTCCSRRLSRASPKRPTASSTTFPPRGRKCTPTTAWWPSTPIGKPSPPCRPAPRSRRRSISWRAGWPSKGAA